MTKTYKFFKWVDSTNRTRTNSDGENPYYSIIHAVDHEPSVSEKKLFYTLIKFTVIRCNIC